MLRDTKTAFGRALTEPGVVEHAELRGRFGFMAFHGGELERRTDLIATAAAEASGASSYVVTHPPPEPHTSRRRTSDAGSPSCSTSSSTTSPSSSPSTATGATACSRRCSSVAAIETSPTTLGRQLAPALPDYQVVTDLPAIPRELRGLHPTNPVNVPPGGGVQLELPPRVRGLGPRWADWDGDGLVPPAAALVDVLAQVASDVGDVVRLACSCRCCWSVPARAVAGGAETLEPLPIEGGTAVAATADEQTASDTG